MNQTYFLFGCNGQDFEISAANCGYSVVTSHSYIWHGLRRGGEPIAIWQYTVAGEGAIDRNGVTHVLKPGDAFFVQVPDDHVYYLPSHSENWEFMYFTFVGNEMFRLQKIFQERHGIVLTHAPDSAAVQYCCSWMNDLERDGCRDRYDSASRSSHFLSELFREFDSTDSRRPRHPLADMAMRLLYSRPGSALTVKELSEHAGCTREHYTRLFQQENGVTPGEYLHDLRLQLAKRSLELEPVTIKEIAFQSGYATPEYFCRAFRKKFGLTPGEFRANMKKQKMS